MLRTSVNYIVIIKYITRWVIKRWSNNKVKLRQQKIPIISVEIMKTIDEREMQKKQTNKQTNKQNKTERSKGNRSYGEWVRAKWFCCAFKLGFFQLICKAFLIFKSNLEIAWSITLKETGLSESKHVTLECSRCLKIWDWLSFLISSSILVLKWRQVSPI